MSTACMCERAAAFRGVDCVEAGLERSVRCPVYVGVCL